MECSLIERLFLFCNNRKMSLHHQNLSLRMLTIHRPVAIWCNCGFRGQVSTVNAGEYASATVKRAAKLCSLFVLLLCIGCTTANKPNPGWAISSTPTQNPDLDIIATDLISALMQIKGYEPFYTTIQYSESNSSFGAAVASVLKLAGYGVQKVRTDQGRNYIYHRQSELQSDTGKSYRFSISIGTIEISREFQAYGSKLFPTTPITIAGATLTNVVVNDELYKQRGGNITFPSGVVFIGSEGEKLEYKFRKVKARDGLADITGEVYAKERFLIIARSSIFRNSGTTRTIDIRGWPATRQVTLRFPSSNPDFLGAGNKSAIQKLIRGYDTGQSGFTITGCARHKTLLWDGTEADALERQQRIKTELLTSGIDIERVREFGCYGSPYDLDLPENAVILTLHRSPLQATLN